MSAGARERLLVIFEAALGAVNGRRRVAEYLRAHPPRAPVSLIAIGKAACAMALGADDALGTAIGDALVVTKHGYGESLPWPVREAGHPLPDEASLAAGAALFDFVDRIPEDSQVLVLLSGGASALVERLPEGMSLGQLRELNRWLLAGGFAIAEMNAVRRRLSRIKGGRLAQRLAPRAVLALAISDVPGDDPRTIGSGPLSPDAEAGRPLDLPAAPETVQRWLRRPPPAPLPGDPCFAAVRLEIVARLDDAKAAAAEAAAALGYAVVRHNAFVGGDAAAAGEALARILLQSPARTVHVWGGEPTVRLPREAGRGGRAQHLALAAARALAGQSGVALLAGATDGSDGPTEDAGAIVDGGTVARGEVDGVTAGQALCAADSGGFLETAGDLLHTGPTGTNAMDLMIGIRTD